MQTMTSGPYSYSLTRAYSCLLVLTRTYSHLLALTRAYSYLLALTHTYSHLLILTRARTRVVAGSRAARDRREPHDGSLSRRRRLKTSAAFSPSHRTEQRLPSPGIRRNDTLGGKVQTFENSVVRFSPKPNSSAVNEMK
eukprot:2998061-Pyramimonas_sp.AAC.1